MSDSTIMISAELSGLIPEFEDEILLDRSDTLEIVYKLSSNGIEHRAPLSTITSNFQIECLFDLKKAIEIFKNRDDIILEYIQVIYRDLNMPIEGQFKLGDVAIKNVNHEKQICLLCFRLLDKADKQVIF